MASLMRGERSLSRHSLRNPRRRQAWDGAPTSYLCRHPTAAPPQGPATLPKSQAPPPKGLTVSLPLAQPQLAQSPGSKNICAVPKCKARRQTEPCMQILPPVSTAAPPTLPGQPPHSPLFFYFILNRRLGMSPAVFLVSSTLLPQPPPKEGMEATHSHVAPECPASCPRHVWGKTHACAGGCQ